MAIVIRCSGHYAGGRCPGGFGIRAAIAAISLGISGPKAFTRRVGRNETFNHAGNACSALLAGGLAYLFGPVVVFYLMAS